jgi:hypothetical protein
VTCWERLSNGWPTLIQERCPVSAKGRASTSRAQHPYYQVEDVVVSHDGGVAVDHSVDQPKIAPADRGGVVPIAPQSLRKTLVHLQECMIEVAYISHGRRRLLACAAGPLCVQRNAMDSVPSMGEAASGVRFSIDDAPK